MKTTSIASDESVERIVLGSQSPSCPRSRCAVTALIVNGTPSSRGLESELLLLLLMVAVAVAVAVVMVVMIMIYEEE